MKTALVLTFLISVSFSLSVSATAAEDITEFASPIGRGFQNSSTGQTVRIYCTQKNLDSGECELGRIGFTLEVVRLNGEEAVDALGNTGIALSSVEFTNHEIVAGSEGMMALDKLFSGLSRERTRRHMREYLLDRSVTNWQFRPVLIRNSKFSNILESLDLELIANTAAKQVVFRNPTFLDSNTRRSFSMRSDKNGICKLLGYRIAQSSHIGNNPLGSSSVIDAEGAILKRKFSGRVVTSIVCE